MSWCAILFQYISNVIRPIDIPLRRTFYQHGYGCHHTLPNRDVIYFTKPYIP
ncbi:hypothetical protein HYC85_008686 [Camellia sinensis]|uniref:Uncharacterized protein n=1 Tax=Camellia sinensis TaxID=4442 RepID=A0A7J7HSK0_CAMSI|nr:hypothetical protein HYC85_008686 [Camellia sinensis]